jgi:hypothetical protein
MTLDTAEWWWSNTDSGPYADASGTICYVEGGRRRSAWAAGDPFFGGPCDAE